MVAWQMRQPTEESLLVQVINLSKELSVMRALVEDAAYLAQHKAGYTAIYCKLAEALGPREELLVLIEDE